MAIESHPECQMPCWRGHAERDQSSRLLLLNCTQRLLLLFFSFTLVTCPRRSLSFTLSDTRVYEPPKRARFGTTAQFCTVVVLEMTRVVPGTGRTRQWELEDFSEERWRVITRVRKMEIRLPVKGNSNSHGARPVY